jgi:hypothetical protein
MTSLAPSGDHLPYMDRSTLKAKNRHTKISADVGNIHMSVRTAFSVNSRAVAVNSLSPAVLKAGLAAVAMVFPGSGTHKKRMSSVRPPLA